VAKLEIIFMLSNQLANHHHAFCYPVIDHCINYSSELKI